MSTGSHVQSIFLSYMNPVRFYSIIKNPPINVSRETSIDEFIFIDMLIFLRMTTFIALLFFCDK